MAKVPKSGLREVHIDIGSHNENPGKRMNIYNKKDVASLLDSGYVAVVISDYARGGLKIGDVISRHKTFSSAEKKAGFSTTESVRFLDSSMRKNPAPRIGTARPRRASQITKKAPSKRLVERRAANTRRGYFPNPDYGVRAAVAQNGDFVAFTKDIATAKQLAAILNKHAAEGVTFTAGAL